MKLRITIDFNDEPELGYEELEAAFASLIEGHQRIMDTASDGVTGKLTQDGDGFEAIAYEPSLLGFQSTVAELLKAAKEFNVLQLKIYKGNTTDLANVKFIVAVALGENAKAIAEFVDSLEPGGSNGEP